MKKLNKKGFTLVELLAVIVILALLMVVAASTVGTVQENAKKNTLKTEAQKIATSIYQEAQSAYMLSSSDLTANSTLIKDKGTCEDSTKTTRSACIGASKTWTPNYYVNSNDGKYKYVIYIESSTANIKSVCMTYEKFKININNTSDGTASGTVKSGSPTIPDDVKITDDGLTAACS